MGKVVAALTSCQGVFRAPLRLLGLRGGNGPDPAHRDTNLPGRDLQVGGEGLRRPRRITPSERRAPLAVSRIQAIAPESVTSPTFTPVA